MGGQQVCGDVERLGRVVLRLGLADDLDVRVLADVRAERLVLLGADWSARMPSTIPISHGFLPLQKLTASFAISRPAMSSRPAMKVAVFPPFTFDCTAMTGMPALLAALTAVTIAALSIGLTMIALTFAPM